MKSKNLKTAAQLLVVCLIAFAACKKGLTYEYFRIKIDEITVDGLLVDGEIHEYKWIYVGDSVVIRFHGVIGPNVCHEFGYFDLNVLEQPTKIEVQAWGKKFDDGNCHLTLEKPLLDDYVVVIPFKDPGTYTFYDFLQPDVELLTIEVN